MVVADFNGDGKLDLAVANYYNSNVGVLLGNGTGGFATATTFSSGATEPEFDGGELAVADFNGDGHLDLAVLNYEQ